MYGVVHMSFIFGSCFGYVVEGIFMIYSVAGFRF
jgi:hypothetical protein